MTEVTEKTFQDIVGARTSEPYYQSDIVGRAVKDTQINESSRRSKKIKLVIKKT